MKIALYSDLHLEIYRQPWSPPDLGVDVVLLAGDISLHTHGLKWAASMFGELPKPPLVIYVAGNHEYYDAHLGLLFEMKKPSWKALGVQFMEKETTELDGVRILGCTLWSGFSLYGEDKVNVSMTSARQSINDYWLIKVRGGIRLEPQHTLKLHQESVKWLDEELDKPFDGKTVVVTHFAPHRGCVAPQHEGSSVSPYFVTDLAWLMEKHRIDVWCHGHTHTNNDFIAENGCRVISNQRCYPNEVATGKTGFREGLVIEL